MPAQLLVCFVTKDSHRLGIAHQSYYLARRLCPCDDDCHVRVVAAQVRGVNVTLGLPFIRTSVDHGTAFDIAGTGRADPGSLVAAIHLAARLAAKAETVAAAP